MTMMATVSSDVADETGDDRRTDQHDDHEVAELVEQQAPEGPCAFFLQGVGAVLSQPANRSTRVQTRSRVSLQALRDFLGRQHVPVIPANEHHGNALRQWSSGYALPLSTPHL